MANHHNIVDQQCIDDHKRSLEIQFLHIQLSDFHVQNNLNFYRQLVLHHHQI